MDSTFPREADLRVYWRARIEAALPIELTEIQRGINAAFSITRDISEATWSELLERVGELLHAARTRQGTGPRPTPTRPSRAQVYTGARPISPGSVWRRITNVRDRWLPPDACSGHTGGVRLTVGMISVASEIAREVKAKGYCDLAVPVLAFWAGVSDRWVQVTLRVLQLAGLVTVERRRIERRLNRTNVVHIACERFLRWITRRPDLDRDRPRLHRQKKVVKRSSPNATLGRPREDIGVALSRDSVHSGALRARSVGPTSPESGLRGQEGAAGGRMAHSAPASGARFGPGRSDPPPRRMR